MTEAMIITPVVDKCVDYIFSSTYQELQYLRKFRSNIQSLRDAIESLEMKRKDISLLVDEAKTNAQVIGSQVEKWVNDVEAIKREVDIILEGERRAQMGCLFNFKCPNLKVRYSLSKKAATKTKQIAALEEKGEFPRVGYPAPIVRRPFTSPLEVFGFKSRLEVEERVMKALLDDNIPTVAICGMGGAGKTTMVKKIADEMINKNHFDEFSIAIVSQNYDPINVQKQLAEKLGVAIKEETLEARADRLYSRLMDEGKRTLLIIDDLWKEIDLCAIGIPSEDKRKGLKVLLTSRFARVCSKMDAKNINEVGELSEDEAWDLFKKHANISDDDSHLLEGYPKRVANKCHGLPLAIEVIGNTFKGRKQLSEWRDALRQLETDHEIDTSEDTHENLYSKIAWSVNYIQTQQRSLLLLCSLFPEDYEIPVEDLVRCAKGMQFFKGIEKMAESRDRVDTICKELKDCYLLIHCDNHCVKLHDVVRDTCLRIATEGENIYLVSHSGLREWPDKDTYECYTSISLTFDDLNEIPSGLKCSRLQLLRLSFRNRRSRININYPFLHAMQEVRVLNIKFCGIKLPPQSLQTSTSIRTLNLHDCDLLGDLSPLLEGLVKVEVLSFFNSTYKGKWPREIAQLNNLKSLDLRFRGGMSESLPTGILIHLKKLEELYLNLDLPIRVAESYEFISEIRTLSNLNTIGFKSPGQAVLAKNLDAERLLKFYISPEFVYSQPYQFSRTMIVHNTNIDKLLEPKMKALLSKVDENFELQRVTGFNNDFYGGSIFSQTKRLKLRGCEMKYICNTTNSLTRAGFFVNLEALHVEDAEYLEELCHGNIPPGSFARLKIVRLRNVPRLSCLWGPIKPPCLGNLRRLIIHNGEMIKNLFLRSSVKCFAQLRYIYIGSCPKLESLVSSDGQIERDIVEDKSEFLELEKLHPVPKRNHQKGIVTFQSLTELRISGCERLKHLFTPSTAKMFTSLKELEIKRCGRMESVIGSEEVNEAETIEEEILLPELCILRLAVLPGLRMLSSQSVDLVLPSFKDFTIWKCPRINRFCAGNLIAPELKQVKFYNFASGGFINEMQLTKNVTVNLEKTKKWFKDCELGKRCIDCALYENEEGCDHLIERIINE